MGKIVKVTFLLLFTIYFVSCEDSVQPFSKNKATKIEALVTANLIEIKSIEFELDKKLIRKVWLRIIFLIKYQESHIMYI